MTHNFLVEDVFKSADNTVKRLFNHRPFTDGEIRSFIMNFEEKNSCEKASDILDNSSERLCDIHQNLVPKLGTVSIEEYKNIIERTNNIDRSMEDILKIEIDAVERRKEQIEEFINDENAKLVKYMQQMLVKMEQIEQEFNRKREQIQNEFAQKASQI